MDAAERQEGGTYLGQKLRTIQGINVRDELYDKLVEAFEDGDCLLTYAFLTEDAAANELQIEDIETVGEDKIVLTLDRDATSQNADGEVILTVRGDGRENERKSEKKIRKRRFNMTINLPENREINGFTYIDQISTDAEAITDDVERANYLLAFKLLSRCK